jgi:membrane protein implicated in regulation of membrane protease activity
VISIIFNMILECLAWSIIAVVLLTVFANLIKGDNSERRLNTSDERLRKDVAERRHAHKLFY